MGTHEDVDADSLTADLKAVDLRMIQLMQLQTENNGITSW
jgi:hypothetical protein